MCTSAPPAQLHRHFNLKIFSSVLQDPQNISKDFVAKKGEGKTYSKIPIIVCVAVMEGFWPQRK